MYLKANIHLHLLKNLDEISKHAVELFSSVHQNSNNRFYIVPGGSTPKPFYKLLAKNISDWSNTQFILSDERIVVEKKELSNAVMLEESFLMNIETENLPEFYPLISNANYSTIEKTLQFLKPKLTILGLGADGHTASLFPGNPDIFKNDDNITVSVKNEWEDFERISLSIQYLMRSEQILFLVMGANRAKALHFCLNEPFNPEKYPAQYIFHNFENSIFLIIYGHNNGY